jgi:myosin-crossreactive antigen
VEILFDSGIIPYKHGLKNNIQYFYGIRMQDFYDVLSGFKKRGKNLTENEMECIWDLIESPAISINFVKKMVNKCGVESISKAHLISNTNNIDYIHYLLRIYKGHFFRNRYPNISFK